MWKIERIATNTATNIHSTILKETAPTSAVLSPVSDEFFREHMFTDYGAMNEAVHGKLEELKRVNPHLGEGVVHTHTCACTCTNRQILTCTSWKSS